MKRVLVLVVALLTMVAFASTALAQAPAKTAAPEKAAPAPAPKAAAEKAKPKADKPKVVKGATVAAYQPGQMIAVKVKDKEMKFDIAPDAKVKGEVKEGAKVNVTYKKDGDKMVATAISGPAPKKEAPKKEAPKKEAPKQTEAPKK